ncbi:MAG: hypothetical protein JNK49_00650 [Planctomycetes bacterium]|nr:hypothetical protein [Planctomycetota bacterium]
MARSSAAPSPQVVGSELLADGSLAPVPIVAEQVLGRPVGPDTARRWAVAGRRGKALATVHGWQRQRMTTPSAMRAWLAAVAHATPTAPPPTRDHAADAVLESFGLGRGE